MPKPPASYYARTPGNVLVISPSQIRNPLRILTRDELAKLSTEALTNRAHTALTVFKDSMRKSVEYARAVGQVLNVLKERMKHGEWEAWRSKNFPRMSKESAALYMRIDRKWKRIAALGDELCEMTLADLNAYLSKPRAKAPTAPASEDTAAAPDTPAPAESEKPQLNLDDAEPSQAAPSEIASADVKQIYIRLDKLRASEFADMVSDLKESLGADHDSDTIYRAVELCWKEKCRA